MKIKFKKIEETPVERPVTEPLKPAETERSSPRDDTYGFERNSPTPDSVRKSEQERSERERERELTPEEQHKKADIESELKKNNLYEDESTTNKIVKGIVFALRDPRIRGILQRK